MKYLTYFKPLTTFLLLSVIMSSCSSTSSKPDATTFADPRKVAERYFDAISKNDLDEAKKYADKDMQAEIAAHAASPVNSNPAADAKYKVLTAAINGNMAEVEVRLTSGSLAGTLKLSVRMVREAGKWLVSSVRNENLNMTGAAEDVFKTGVDGLTTALNVYDDSKLSKDLKVQKQAILDSIVKLQAKLKPNISLEERAALQERFLEIQTNYAAFIAEVAAAQMPQP